MYYKLFDEAFKAPLKAWSKGNTYRIAAAIVRNNSIIKINHCTRFQTHPIANRFYSDNNECVHCLHAEMAVLPFANPGDHIHILRVDAQGNLRPALPCPFCAKLIEAAAISKIYCYHSSKKPTVYRLKQFLALYPSLPKRRIMNNHSVLWLKKGELRDQQIFSL